MSATVTHVRMELEAQYKTVTVKIQDLGLDKAQANVDSQMHGGASGPPLTPSHPGASESVRAFTV